MDAFSANLRNRDNFQGLNNKRNRPNYQFLHGGSDNFDRICVYRKWHPGFLLVLRESFLPIFATLDNWIVFHGFFDDFASTFFTNEKFSSQKSIAFIVHVYNGPFVIIETFTAKIARFHFIHFIYPN